MVAALEETLLNAQTVPAVHADVQALIDAEVAGKKGASGLALRTGYAAVRKVGPTIVPRAVERLLPAFVEKLEPFWQDHAGNGSFAEYLARRDGQVADALLGVTDERIAATSNGAITKVYASLRPSARRHVVDAVPRLGSIIDKHAG